MTTNKKQVKANQIYELVANLQKHFGGGSIHYLGDDSDTVEFKGKNRYSSGLYELDWGMSGGLVGGTIIELFGNEGEGKTTLALKVVSALQNIGKQVFWLDAEHTLNLEYAQKLGVKTDELLISQPDYGEQGLDITQAVLFSGMVDVCVIDSVTALVPKADIDGDFTDANMGAHARLMSKMCRTLTPVIGTNDIVFIVINQIRMKIGVFFGSPEVTTGGKALKFYSGMRLRVSSSQVKKGDTVDQTKRLVKIKFAKQKWGAPFREVEEILVLGEGFDEGFDMLQYGVRVGIIVQASSFYKFSDGTALGNGKSVASQALLEADNRSKFETLLKEKKHEN